MIFKFITFLVASTLASRTLYPLTHDDDAPLPELFGLVVGVLLIFCAFVALRPEDKAAQADFIAAASSVGLGVALSRLLMML